MITVVCDNGGYLINANSEDFVNFPVAAIGFDRIRVLKIYGYN
jgi:hypothetical protein